MLLEYAGVVKLRVDFDTSGVGFRVWDAAVILTVWLYRHKELFAGKRVIEIGAGCDRAWRTMR